MAPCFSKRTFAKGAYLFFPSSPCLNIYLVESGLIRMFFANSVGQEFMVDLIGPLAPVGLLIMRENQTRITGAAALQPSTVLVLSQQDLKFFSQRSPRLMDNILQEIDATFRKLARYARMLATISLDGRLATVFLYLTREDIGDGGKSELPLSQSDIAAWVGASRGALNRSLSRLQHLGLIRVEGHQFIILDRPGLERMTEDLLLDQE